MPNSKASLEEKDIKKIKDLYEFMKQESLLDLDLQDGDLNVSLKRYQPHRDAEHTTKTFSHLLSEHAALPVEEQESAAGAGDFISTPLMGTFYRSPSPNANPFVREGGSIEAGQVLCIVEAMKVMNEIRADKACRIKEILVENGKPVTAGEHLFQVEFL
jgi:acetyl-CoA carboxylase biotin carboxyl carrier protein